MPPSKVLSRENKQNPTLASGGENMSIENPPTWISEGAFLFVLDEGTHTAAIAVSNPFLDDAEWKVQAMTVSNPFLDDAEWKVQATTSRRRFIVPCSKCFTSFDKRKREYLQASSYKKKRASSSNEQHNVRRNAPKAHGRTVSTANSDNAPVSHSHDEFIEPDGRNDHGEDNVASHEPDGFNGSQPVTQSNKSARSRYAYTLATNTSTEISPNPGLRFKVDSGLSSDSEDSYKEQNGSSDASSEESSDENEQHSEEDNLPSDITEDSCSDQNYYSGTSSEDSSDDSDSVRYSDDYERNSQSDGSVDNVFRAKRMAARLVVDEQCRSDGDKETETSTLDEVDGESKAEALIAQFDASKQALVEMGISKEEAEAGLRDVGPPYKDVQRASKIIAARCRSRDEPIQVVDGMEIRKYFDGEEYRGFVVGDATTKLKRGKYVKVWHVCYNDGDNEDLEENEILRYQHPPPSIYECRGRPMQCLELFCGNAVVSQEFRLRQWKVASVDILEDSNATIKKDILDLDAKDLGFVPDFIWASPPCETYSNMGAGKHRSARTEEFEKTQEAIDHNFLFTKMAQIMQWARELHPHLVVVIENPVGSLARMPCMVEFSKSFGLHDVIVNYCAFGRDEKKPTILWTNDFGLQDTLSYFTCPARCLAGGSGNHQLIQQTGHDYDYSVIPQPLAEEVSEYVDAKFVMERIRRRPATLPGTSFS